jgi:molecular chaperone GrpE
MEEKNNNQDSQVEKEATIEELKKKIEELEKLKQEYLAGWQRERADFINYKKEEAERLEKFIDDIKIAFFMKFLPILDNLDIIVKNIQKEDKNPLFKSFLNLEKQIKNFFQKEGFETIETIGKKFDPYLHEAIEMVEIGGEESGKVVDEIQKGYKFKGTVLRPSKVKVNK